MIRKREIKKFKSNNLIFWRCDLTLFFSFNFCRKRKAKKYVQLACAKRPTAASICDALFNKQPSRIGFLRPDALSILLHMANVGPGAKNLVLENSGGMVTGAVAERMGGYGSVCATYLEPHPRGIEISASFNFSPEILASISRASLVALLKTRREQLQTEQEERANKDDNKVEGTEDVDTDNKDVLESETGAEAMPVDPPAAAVAEASNPVDTANAPADTVAVANSSKAKVANPPFSGCIISNPTLHPKTALRAVFPLLAPSATFAVWSQQLQPLAEAMNDLRASGTAVSLAVQETWYRKQQVLPKRTHPGMNMNHGGGYLLSGIVTVAGTQVPMPRLPETLPLV